jgi:hypothetical protein
MGRDLEKEVFNYKENKNDPEVPKIPEGAILEAWQSFSIVIIEVNYFGFCSEEYWLNNFEILTKRY